MKKLTLLLIAMAVCSASFAATSGNAVQSLQAQGEGGSPLSSATCSFTFSSGANDSFLKFCVTANGNITQLETPKGHEHIAVAQIGEGYGVCDFGPQAQYFDYAQAGDSGNWRPSSVVSQTSKSVTIARTTNDGIWTLTQTITQVPSATPSVKISMTLKNNSNIDRSALLFRYADVDADGALGNNLDTTFNSAVMWNSVGTNSGYGLMAQNLSPRVVFRPLTQSEPGGPLPCAAVFLDKLTTDADGSLGMAFGASVPKGRSVTVSLSYTGL